MIFHTFLLICLLLQSASGILDEHDQDRLLKLFKSTYPFKDIQTAYQATTVVAKLGNNFQKQEETKICGFIKKEVKEDDLASLFHASSVKKILKKCKLEFSKPAKELIAETIASEANDVTKLYYAYETQKNLGTNDKSASLSAILKEVNRTSVVQHSQVLKLATFTLQASAGEFLQEVTDIIERADETKVRRYFSEGFSASVEFLTNAFQLSEYLNEKPPIDPATLEKFISDILIHKYTERLSEAFGVVSIFSSMSHSSLYSPLSIRLADSSNHLSASNTNLDILVTDLLNSPAIAGISVGVDEYNYTGKTETVSQQMTHVSNGVYRLPLTTLPPIGMVDFTLDVRAENKYIPTQIKITNKVVTSLNVDKLDFTLRDQGQSKPLVEETVTYPGKLSSQPSADQHQIIAVKLSVKDGQGNRYSPHQVFVAFVEKKTGNEVFFVGQPSTSGAEHYVIDIDLGAAVKESFRSISGDYDFSMLIGDPFGSNAIQWDLGRVTFTFPPGPPVPEPEILYEPLPEIHHEFKKPEPRPPAIVSNIFCAVVLSPWLILLVFWPKVGVNIRNLFSFGLSGIVFQISLVAIAALYALYWFRLNMFQTLFYLSGLSLVAFLAGHRTLRTRAANRMK